MQPNESAVSRIEAYLAGFSARLALPPALREAIEYSLLSGGKRLRPLLAWESAAAVGGDGELTLCAGAAVELVHAFSLVHDDLPAMDNDELRRGRPTLHIHAGEAMAILAGDAMLALAFHALSEIPDAGLAIRLCRELSAGTEGMIAGQVYDTLGGLPAGTEPRQKLELIHRNKTGALIRASCRMGAACAGVTDQSEAMRSITAFAEAVGLMFQIVDDVLDVTQSQEHVGKRTHKDAQAGKLTYPGALGLEESRRAVAQLQAQSLEAVRSLGAPAEGLRELARLIANRQR